MRQSDKHGPRGDEDLKKEASDLLQGSPTTSRAREDRDPEPPADGEPMPTYRLDSAGDNVADGALSDEEVQGRRQIASSLEGSVFPARKDELLESARRVQAGEGVIRQLSSLPEDQEFENVQAVWEALGGHAEKRF